jgi:hypothetical protein
VSFARRLFLTSPRKVIVDDQAIERLRFDHRNSQRVRQKGTLELRREYGFERRDIEFICLSPVKWPYGKQTRTC